MKTPLVQAFGYLRVSGRGQLGGDGFPRQREAIARHAKQNGIEIVQWFEERGVCGATEWENRPAWVEMMRQLNGVRMVIIERLDRLARELFIQEYVLRDLKKRGVVLVSATEQDIDSDPTRVLFRQIMGAIAEYDRQMIVLKLRAARKRVRLATGRCEGRKRFGEKPGEAEIVERMAALRKQGMPYDAIAELFNAEGIPTRAVGRGWFGSSIAKILRRQ